MRSGWRRLSVNDDNNGICDTDEILGCTYELADNSTRMGT